MNLIYSEKQLLKEVRYLRITSSPNIRERYKLPSGKFQKLSEIELRAQIQNSLAPTPNEVHDLDELFLSLQDCLKFLLYIFNISLVY